MTLLGLGFLLTSPQVTTARVFSLHSFRVSSDQCSELACCYVKKTHVIYLLTYNFKYKIHSLTKKQKKISGSLRSQPALTYLFLFLHPLLPSDLSRGPCLVLSSRLRQTLPRKEGSDEPPRKVQGTSQGPSATTLDLFIRLLVQSP